MPKSLLRNTKTVRHVNQQIDELKNYLLIKANQLSQPNVDRHVLMIEIKTTVQLYLLNMITTSRDYVSKATGHWFSTSNHRIAEMIQIKSEKFVTQFLQNYQKITGLQILEASLSDDEIDTFDWMLDRNTSDLMMGTWNDSQNLFFFQIPNKDEFKKVFNTMEDDSVCEECDGYDEQEFDLNDDSAPDIPDDTHPNCRCWYIITKNGEEFLDLS